MRCQQRASGDQARDVMVVMRLARPDPMLLVDGKVATFEVVPLIDPDCIGHPGPALLDELLRPLDVMDDLRLYGDWELHLE